MATAVVSYGVRSGNRILVASANSSLRKQLMTDVNDADGLAEEAFGGAHALAKLGQCACDRVWLDRDLPDLDAAEVAELIRQRFPQMEVELVGPGPEAKSVSGELEPHFARLSVHETPGISSDVKLGAAETLPGMIGSSNAMQQVYQLVRLVAQRDATVLITGETGTGKELVAHAIHQLSRRSSQPFVVVNCAAIPEALLEAELFGHARGAFTGAVQSRLGRIHTAQGGTLFLDEVGELPLSMQAKLLRFLQNGEVQRLGTSDVSRVDVRVLCATNVPLLDLVYAGQFRRDLYYRLAVFPIALPPLRERAADLAVLAGHFLLAFARQAELPCKTLSPSAATLLHKATWKGNVRELQHAIERACILAGESLVIQPEHIVLFGESQLSRGAH
jgi:transcriptional regulator with GAF, ATPase, and Fis domain